MAQGENSLRELGVTAEHVAHDPAFVGFHCTSFGKRQNDGCLLRVRWSI